MRRSNSLALAVLGCAAACVTALCGPQAGQSQQASSRQAPAPATRPAATQPAAMPLYVGERREDWKSYQAMHAYFLDRFVNSRGFGQERMPVVNEARFHTLYADATHYRVGTVQLLSLNQGHKPFVYTTPPSIDADKALIKQAGHGAVTDAEVEALEKLKKGDEVVLTGDGGHRELVGAVRATAACIKCHQVTEGTLLGAFRYPLVTVALEPSGLDAGSGLQAVPSVRP